MVVFVDDLDTFLKVVLEVVVLDIDVAAATVVVDATDVDDTTKAFDVVVDVDDVVVAATVAAKE